MAGASGMRGRSADIPGTKSASLGTAPSVPRGGGFPAMSGSGQIRDLGGRFAGGMAVVWIGLPILASLPERVQSDMHGATDKALVKLQTDMVDYAKANAPWEDVTGDARAELHSPAITTAANGDKSVILAHGVDYGGYLETKNGGQFAIIAPTIQEFASRLPAYLGEGVSLP